MGHIDPAGRLVSTLRRRRGTPTPASLSAEWLRSQSRDLVKALEFYKTRFSTSNHTNKELGKAMAAVGCAELASGWTQTWAPPYSLYGRRSVLVDRQDGCDLTCRCTAYIHDLSACSGCDGTVQKDAGGENHRGAGGSGDQTVLGSKNELSSCR